MVLGWTFRLLFTEIFESVELGTLCDRKSHVSLFTGVGLSLMSTSVFGIRVDH